MTGWVLEADAGTVDAAGRLAQSTANTTTSASAIPVAQLNLHVGGTAGRSATTPAPGGFALHDPLADLAGVELEGDAVSYLVAGWWSASADDPLDGVGTDVGLPPAPGAAGLERPRPSEHRRLAP